MNDIVSIIIPVYKVEAFIEVCARSLFDQTLKEVEYIFVDDCGGDRSIQIIKDVLEFYPHRKPNVRFIHNEYSVGSASARNLALAHAQGNYLAFCDGDDWMVTTALESMCQFASGGDYDLIWADFFYNYPDKELIGRQISDVDNDSCICALLTEKIHGALWNKLYKRSLFEESGVRFIDGVDLWEDLCVNIQLFYQAKNIGYLATPIYHYRQRVDGFKASEIVENKRFQDLMTHVQAINTFLVERTGERFQNEILILKLAAKKNLLFGKEMSSFKRWKNIYPESNHYIFQLEAVPYHFRVLGWCSTKGLWTLIGVWLIFKRFKN